MEAGVILIIPSPAVIGVSGLKKKCTCADITLPPPLQRRPLAPKRAERTSYYQEIAKSRREYLPNI